MRLQAQRLQQIGGDEGFFAVGEGGGVAGEGVVVDAEDGGVFGAEAAGQEAGDEAGEEVAGAGGGHAGIATHADTEAAAGFGDEGVVAFEDGDGVVVGGDGAGGGGAVTLDVVRGDAEEAGGFAGVGGEDEAEGGGVGRPALFQTELGEGGKGVCIDHGARGLGIADEPAEEVQGLGVEGAHAGADGDGLIVREFAGGAGLFRKDGLWGPVGGGHARFRGNGEGDKAAAGAIGRLGGEDGGVGIARATADDEGVAVGTLVGIEDAFGAEDRADLGGGDELGVVRREGGLGLEDVVGDTDVGH